MGKAREAKGKAREAKGKASKGKAREAKGKAWEAMGKAREAKGKTREAKAAAALRLPSCSCHKYVAKISGAYLPQPLATQPSQPPRALCVGDNPCYAVERQELVAQALGWRLGRAPIHGGADILICEGGLVGLQKK